MQKEKGTSYGLLWAMTMAIIIIFVGYWISIVFFGPTGWSEKGQFGDMFGWVNALFSGLAFAGLIYTIFLQRNELSLQREELRATREEMKGQKEQLEAQNKTWQEQNIDSMFFQLLHYFDQQASNVYLAPQVIGKSAIVALYESFIPQYKDSMSGKEKYNDLEEVIKYFHGYLQKDKSFFSYFRVFSNLVEFVNNNMTRNKIFYAKLINAMLTDSEKALIFYYGLFPEGKHIKEYSEQYGMFSNLNISMIGHVAHKNFYKDSAFTEFASLEIQSQSK